MKNKKFVVCMAKNIPSGENDVYDLSEQIIDETKPHFSCGDFKIQDAIFDGPFPDGMDIETRGTANDRHEAAIQFVASATGAAFVSTDSGHGTVWRTLSLRKGNVSYSYSYRYMLKWFTADAGKRQHTVFYEYK